MSIVEFILARVDDDECIARAAGALGQIADTITTSECDEFAEHIARHDPARVLRQCAALRAIVEAYEYAADRGTDDDSYDIGRQTGEEDALGDALRRIAAIWADHPDHREEWSAA